MNLPEIQLNETQHAAVYWNEGPLLVLAGPGSGKTLVLTLRAARLLKENKDASLLALTFTTKAAEEMRERLDKLMGGHADRAHLSTFHSFAADILRQHGSHVGIHPDFSLITIDDERMVILEQVISNLECDTSSIPLDRKNLLLLLDRLFAESYDGECEVTGIVNTPPWLPQLFRDYCEALQKSNRLDYGGLLYFALKLLSQNAGVVRLTRLAWQYICVDEFQDTNRAQYDFLRLLIGRQDSNLFVVADEDQIIYQWNGASPERLLALQKDFGMKVLQLPENFRCPPVIIQLANNLIIHNRMRSAGKMPLVARRPAAKSPTLSAKIFDNDDTEVAVIPATIKKAGWNTEDCAVLARSTKLLQKAARALNDSGFVPYLVQRKNEFECASISWMHDVLRLANARHDREFLRRTCVAWKDFTGIIIEVDDVEATAALEGGDFLRAWVNNASSKVDSEEHDELLSRTRHDLVDRLFFIELLEWFWTQKWLDDELETEEIKTWQELHETLLREHSLDSMTLHLYLQEMDLKSKAAARLPGSIPCLTVHGSKGLEFKHVFLIGMADEVFPSYQAVRKGSDSPEIEEERRNCFVAITRVKETLNISWARTYNGFRKKPSRFLEEMGFTFSKS